jgi:hypothetical protein
VPRDQEHRAAGPLHSRIRRHRTFSIFTVSPKLYCHSFVARKKNSSSSPLSSNFCGKYAHSSYPQHHHTTGSQPGRSLLALNHTLVCLRGYLLPPSRVALIPPRAYLSPDPRQPPARIASSLSTFAALTHLYLLHLTYVRLLSPKMPSAAPKIAATALMNASQHEKAMLHDIHSLLNNIFARNRNQHGRSHWWKALHAFRKQIGLLLHELEKGKVKERESKVEARLRYWDEGVVHTWY